MDIVSIIGLTVGVAAILLGNVLEGGHMDSLIQMTAALIVLGGTAGAVLLSNTQADILMGIKYFGKCFFDTHSNIEEDLKDIMDCAQLAKKEGLLGIEKRLNDVKNEFLRDALLSVISGIRPEMVRDIFETRIQHEEDVISSGGKIWTDAGGFAPTIGIIGAVLGLIHVMGNLSDPSAIGPGIAVAFVATIYGVASANLIFLPAGNKIKKKAHHHSTERQALLEGALMIGEGVNPMVIEQKLYAYMGMKKEENG